MLLCLPLVVRLSYYNNYTAYNSVRAQHSFPLTYFFMLRLNKCEYNGTLITIMTTAVNKIDYK